METSITGDAECNMDTNFSSLLGHIWITAVDYAVTNTEELQAIITDFRKNIQADKKTYEEWRQWLQPWDPDVWGPVAGVLKARANYFKGEILRAKHNLRHYMLYEPITKQRSFIENWVSTLNNELTELQKAINNARESYQKTLLSDKQSAKKVYNINRSLVDMHLDNLQQLKSLMEKYIYES